MLCPLLIRRGNPVQTDDQSQQFQGANYEAPMATHAHSVHGAESDSAHVSTTFAPGTGRRLKISASAGAIALIVPLFTGYLLTAVRARQPPCAPDSPSS